MSEELSNIVSSSSKSVQKLTANALVKEAESSINAATSGGFFANINPKVKSILVQCVTAVLSAVIIALSNQAASLLLTLANPIGAYILLSIVAIGTAYILWRVIIEPKIKRYREKKAMKATFAEFKDGLNIKFQEFNKDIYNDLENAVEKEYKIDIKQLEKAPSAEYRSQLVRRFKNAIERVTDPGLKEQFSSFDTKMPFSPSLKLINTSKLEKTSPEMKAAKWYNQLLATTHHETPIWSRLEIKSGAADNYLRAHGISKLLKASKDMESVDGKIAQAEKVIEMLFPNEDHFKNSRALLVLLSENITDTLNTSSTLRSFDSEDDEMELEILEFIGKNLALVPNTIDDALRMLSQAIDIQQSNSINIQHSATIEASTLVTPPPSPTSANLPKPKPAITDDLDKSRTNSKTNFILSNDRES